MCVPSTNQWTYDTSFESPFLVQKMSPPRIALYLAYLLHWGPKMTLFFVYHFGTGMVETLALKTTAWENERGIDFTYDGVSWAFSYLWWFNKRWSELFLIICSSDSTYFHAWRVYYLTKRKRTRTEKAKGMQLNNSTMYSLSSCLVRVKYISPIL